MHTNTQLIRPSLDMAQLNPTSSLSVEQSQYFNSLSSQNNGVQNVPTFQSPANQYSNSYGGNNYIDQVSNVQSVTRKPKARVPPPSKVFKISIKDKN